MRFLMKQKVWSLRDTYVIRDEAGNDAFRVTAKVWSFGDQLAFEDLHGNQLAYIEQKVMSLGPTYLIHRDGALAATVKKKVFAFRPHYDIALADGGALAVDGNFSAHEYAITRDGAAIATVSMQWFSWADTFGIEVADGEDPILALAIAVVLEMVDHDRDD